jgi:hypothetical protein
MIPELETLPDRCLPSSVLPPAAGFFAIGWYSDIAYHGKPDASLAGYSAPIQPVGPILPTGVAGLNEYGYLASKAQGVPYVDGPLSIDTSAPIYQPPSLDNMAGIAQALLLSQS